MPEPTNTQSTTAVAPAQGSPNGQNGQTAQAIPCYTSSMNRLPADHYFKSQTFDKDLAKFQQFKDRKTGYANMDTVQSLYPGFYVLGAISSLGKTTFIHQMSDQCASAGVPVLYYSLEQNALELYTKSLSRRIYKQSLNDVTYRRFSSIDIRRGLANGTRELQEQINAYTSDVGNQLMVVECNFSASVEDIEKDIYDFISAYNVTPIVVIDYLQIITPSVIGKRPLEGKASIDHIVHSLKSFQNINNLVLIAICSLNRQNYMTTIDFESFKESGGIEYTADVVWGLQLQVIHSDIFSKEGKIKEKRETIMQAKNAIPRQIELVALKNRYGRASYSVNFEYNPVYDTFIPIMDTDGDDDTSDQSQDDYWNNIAPGAANPFA